MAQALNGLDPVMARKSLDRYYEVFGRRGIVSYMREEFDFHRSEGRLILLVSASPEYLVRRHAEDIGLPPDNAFGTRVDVDEEGKVSFTLLRSDQKVTLLQEEVLARLDEAGINYKITHAYSDSDSDIPMFELTREQGGVVISTNAPREVFERKVLAEMDGIAVRDRRDARETVLFDDADAGQLIHRDATVAPTPTYWREDLKSYGKVAGQSAAAFAVAASLVTLLVGAMPGGTADLSDVFLNGGFGAFGGGVGRVGGHFFTPKSGHISERRRWFMEYGGPLTSAMVFAGMYPGALETLSGTPTLGALFATAMVAGGAIQKATKALRGLARGLGWHSVDRAGQGITGETLMRTTEVAAYSGLGYLLSLLG